jgi:phosphoribosylformimino-5-aminoimidazole carboxamide ribotide isomerase
MDIIPVVDLLGGQVVHARRGERDSYRPIVTPLSRTCDPVDVVGGLLSLYPFPALYAADLDAILRRGDNLSTLSRLRAAFPALRLWIDNGAADAKALAAIFDLDLGVPVLGSESQLDERLVAAYSGSERIVLSLDFRNQQLVGPCVVLENPDAWPARVIVMSLSRVGGGAGPDFDRLRMVRALAGSREIYAAGGVRHAADLSELESIGCAGALAASALHDGRLDRADLEAR